MKKRLASLAVVALIGISSLLPTMEASAQAAPDSTPVVTSINVYRNLLESGDSLYLIYANIPYASIPTTPEPSAFIWQLIALDGTTVLGSTTGFAYNQSGYNQNIYSMYFPSSAGLAWGAAYTVRLVGNPTVFTTMLGPYNTTIPSGSYTSLTSISDNQVALAAYVLSTAAALNIAWALTPTFLLTAQTDTGSTLSIYGQTVFRGSIPGIQVMAPDAFLTQIQNIALVDQHFGNNYTTTLQNQWTGTWVATALQGMVDFFQTGYDLADFLAVLAICLGVLICNLMFTGDGMNGLMDVLLVLIAATRLGAFPLVVLGLVGFVCIVYLGTILFGRFIPR